MGELRIVHENLFAVKADAIVNPVNCVGVMGAGIAKSFKNMFPSMFEAYRFACETSMLRIGTVHVYQEDDGRRIINLPTKLHWKNPSTVEFIRTSLMALAGANKTLKLSTIAMPAIGCGCGGLDFDSQVYPILLEVADTTDLDLTVCLP
jgi:O-acetyl-ADP-ribose deacetylase (regulator of RNase III)